MDGVWTEECIKGSGPTEALLSFRLNSMAYATAALSHPLNQFVSSSFSSKKYPSPFTPKSIFTSTVLVPRHFPVTHLLPRDASSFRRRKGRLYGPCTAYVSAPSTDAFVGGDREISTSDAESSMGSAISWEVIFPLLWRNKLRIAVGMIALAGCTTCTLSMPIYSGIFVLSCCL